MSLALRFAESGIAPDRLIRAGIRALNRQRLRDERRDSIEALHEHQRAFIASLRQSPIAVETRAANEQHYEVPPDFSSMRSASGSNTAAVTILRETRASIRTKWQSKTAGS